MQYRLRKVAQPTAGEILSRRFTDLLMSRTK